MHAEINNRTILYSFACLFVGCCHAGLVFGILTAALHPRRTVTSSSHSCSHRNTMHMHLLNFVIFIRILLCCYIHCLQWRCNLLWMLRLFWARHCDKWSFVTAHTKRETAISVQTHARTRNSQHKYTNNAINTRLEVDVKGLLPLTLKYQEASFSTS